MQQPAIVRQDHLMTGLWARPGGAHVVSWLQSAPMVPRLAPHRQLLLLAPHRLHRDRRWAHPHTRRWEREPSGGPAAASFLESMGSRRTRGACSREVHCHQARMRPDAQVDLRRTSASRSSGLAGGGGPARVITRGPLTGDCSARAGTMWRAFQRGPPRPEAPITARASSAASPAPAARPAPWPRRARPRPACRSPRARRRRRPPPAARTAARRAWNRTARPRR